MMVWIVLSLIFSLCIMLYVVAPLYESCNVVTESAGASVDAVGRLLDSKERSLRAIKDLELDFAMGKVSKEDFDRSYAELSGEVGVILQELRRHG